jgi:putative N6-adenine-specific DNA methylase
MNNFRFAATTLFGLEELLAKELLELGAEEILKRNRAVEFSGSLALMYRANLRLRTALRILLILKTFRVRNEDHLYDTILKIEWENIFDKNLSFAINPVVNSELFRNSQFIAQKTKDAIVDRFRNKTGSRPTVNLSQPDILINIHISNEMVNVSLDSSGEPLFKRGYRTENHQAPLNEVLAAGMIMLAGWDGSENFIDPMCGSGTLPIEAAMIGSGIFPGSFRKHYSFFNWKMFDKRLFELIKGQLPAPKPSPGRVFASDISPDSIEMTKINVKNAGLKDFIKIELLDFKDFTPPEGKGTLMFNPPYGLRIDQEDINQFYKMIGNTMKSKYAGYSSWLISPNLEAMKFIGLHPDKKLWLFNGDLKCRFNRYSIYHGSKKHKDSNNEMQPS